MISQNMKETAIDDDFNLYPYWTTLLDIGILVIWAVSDWSIKLLKQTSLNNI